MSQFNLQMGSEPCCCWIGSRIFQIDPDVAILVLCRQMTD
ncbi:hypothetical protein H206_05652 [Candidatus Electrothrix aarhusensis]|uniref:Uncharacterized protein n=1 Tax=Candidatus Electrothrix aarhusensis TaxID=1859131 RepID=A0A3S3QLG7_9BACT|nr:hypothetical protein H206_05652 [Candidatus Electrothrix aarhusensis]